MADANMEVTKPGKTVYAGFLPDLPPVIAHEPIEDGWRGLTEDGELLEVRGRNGKKAEPPEYPLLIMRGGQAVGYRAIEHRGISIDRYLMHFNRAAALFRSNQNHEALLEADAAVVVAPTTHARFNRSFVLLSLGRWQEGFAEYAACEQGPPFQRPQCKAAVEAGIQPWQGEPLAGKRLLVVHAHGFGDTIMALRYVAWLRQQDIDVVIDAPWELWPLARQVAPVNGDIAENDLLPTADYFVPFLMLPHFCGTAAPADVLPNLRLKADRRSVAWSGNGKRRIGIAWSVGVNYDGDYPRSIPLAELVAALPDAELHSVQVQGKDEAEALGVRTHNFEDFTDCASMMLALDEIITVDTAAAHLAGALERPTTLLLSHWHSWRWLASWYPTMKIRQQQAPGDWASALHGLATNRESIARSDGAARAV
jgi:hypothetical protein